jgi:hypothetical protein
MEAAAESVLPKVAHCLRPNSLNHLFCVILLISLGTSSVADQIHQKNVAVELVSSALTLVAHCHHPNSPNHLVCVIWSLSAVASWLHHQMKILSELVSLALAMTERRHRPSYSN